MPKLQFAYLLGDTSPGVVPRLLWRLAGEHLVFIEKSAGVKNHNGSLAQVGNVRRVILIPAKTRGVARSFFDADSLAL